MSIADPAAVIRITPVTDRKWPASARRCNRSITARSIHSAAGITAYVQNKPLKEVCACPGLSPDFRSAYRQLQSLSLVEMKDEGRAKSDQEHLQFHARRRANEGIHGFDQLLKADDLAIKVRFVESTRFDFVEPRKVVNALFR
jgi:hypothetical protein